MKLVHAKLAALFALAIALIYVQPDLTDNSGAAPAVIAILLFVCLHYCFHGYIHKQGPCQYRYIVNYYTLIVLAITVQRRRALIKTRYQYILCRVFTVPTPCFIRISYNNVIKYAKYAYRTQAGCECRKLCIIRDVGLEQCWYDVNYDNRLSQL